MTIFQRATNGVAGVNRGTTFDPILEVGFTSDSLLLPSITVDTLSRGPRS